MAFRNFRAPLPSLLNFLLPLAMGGGVFREYIGALFTGVKFSDVPIDPRNEFQFLLSFAIDYTADSSPTDGIFNIFWDSGNLSPSAISDIKSQYPNVKVALSIGGDSVGGSPATFHPSSVDGWVRNAVDSLTQIIQQYRLDGIDIDYEHFEKDAGTFAQCIGQLITTLKSNGVISFASIAPFDDDDVQSNYQELWRRYGQQIDYVNFQFYAYDKSTTVSQFLGYYDTQQSNYAGGKVLASMLSDRSGGLTPDNGFFDACRILKQEGKLPGIFMWAADSSKSRGFDDEKQAQEVLAS